MTSCQLSLNFTIEESMSRAVRILSIFNDKLLVTTSDSKLIIYSCEGLYLSTITANDISNLGDATWTPQDNIMYATIGDVNKIVVISETDEEITHTHLESPGSFSISDDGIIYLSEASGIYQSSNDGINWSRIFNYTYGFINNRQVIKVNAEKNDDFWTLERSHTARNLPVCSIERNRFDRNVTCRDISLIKTDGNPIDLSFSSLAYDGDLNIFVSEIDKKAIHVLSVSGQYRYQLLSPHGIRNRPWKLAIDKESQLIYVGQDYGLVEAFKLTYG